MVRSVPHFKFYAVTTDHTIQYAAFYTEKAVRVWNKVPLLLIINKWCLGFYILLQRVWETADDDELDFLL